MASKAGTGTSALVSRTWRGRHSLNVEHIQVVSGRAVRVRLDVEFGSADGESPSNARGEIKLFVPEQGEWKSIYRVPTPDVLKSSMIRFAPKGEYDAETGRYEGYNQIQVRGGAAQFDLGSVPVGIDIADALPADMADLLAADRDELVSFAESLLGAVAA